MQCLQKRRVGCLALRQDDGEGDERLMAAVERCNLVRRVQAQPTARSP